MVFRVCVLVTFVACSVILLSPAESWAVGTFIDFETDGSGNPSGESFPSHEYAAQSVIFWDSDPLPSRTFLDETNPLNVGTAISGKYVNVGAFQDVETFIELEFTRGMSSVGFDWATGAGADSITVSFFDLDGAPLAVFIPHADSGFISPAGFTIPAGSFFGDAGGAEIYRVLIEDQPGATRGLVLDNLVAFADTAAPADPPIDGDIAGMELCPKFICGRALFVGIYTGEVGGNRAFGTWFAAINHEDLPTDPPLDPNGVIDGEWTLSTWVFRGWFPSKETFRGDFEQGSLENLGDNLYRALVPMNVSSGGSGRIDLDLLLDENTFPQSVSGTLTTPVALPK